MSSRAQLLSFCSNVQTVSVILRVFSFVVVGCLSEALRSNTANSYLQLDKETLQETLLEARGGTLSHLSHWPAIVSHAHSPSISSKGYGRSLIRLHCCFSALRAH